MLLALFSLPGSTIGWGIAVAIVLAVAVLLPYLYKEIRRGKADLSPRLPTGTAEPRPGRRGNPAPGHIEGDIDPYSPRATR
jgi:hypothetical protein